VGQIHSVRNHISRRLKWMQYFNKYRNARLTCRHFGISPDTFYLWKKRFNSDNFMSLEDDKKNRRPHKIRVSKHAALQMKTIKKLKKRNPKIGKIRMAKTLKELGFKISPSTITRILKRLSISSL
jgi:transposase